MYRSIFYLGTLIFSCTKKIIQYTSSIPKSTNRATFIEFGQNTRSKSTSSNSAQNLIKELSSIESRKNNVNNGTTPENVVDCEGTASIDKILEHTA